MNRYNYNTEGETERQNRFPDFPYRKLWVAITIISGFAMTIASREHAHAIMWMCCGIFTVCCLYAFQALRSRGYDKLAKRMLLVAVVLLIIPISHMLIFKDTLITPSTDAASSSVAPLVEDFTTFSVWNKIGICVLVVAMLARIVTAILYTATMRRNSFADDRRERWRKYRMTKVGLAVLAIIGVSLILV
ncbi:MAG: hypothetical protein NC111_07700 [Bacteroides sp.]|nr:hypothetical protein [Bacteroides sp.]MCM1414233.1 hypothetical protein [Bacteroides sp.]MCM1472392.1 hypothetical protein [Bacteroides sp.]